MIRAENLIVEGKCFVASKIDAASIDRLKGILTRLMASKLYEPSQVEPLLYPSNFLSMSYSLSLLERGTHLLDRFKKGIGLISQHDLSWKKYAKSLSATRDDMPFTVTFCFIPTKLQNSEGFAIKIRSEPVIIFKMRNLSIRPKIDEFDYSIIIDSNKQFINEIMLGIGAHVLEKPQTIAEYVVTPTLEKLEKFGFSKIVDLLKQGQTKIERGDTEDGLTDLREALADFVGELVRRKGQKPTNNMSQNLGTLKELGYIDKWSYEVIHKFLYDWIYSYLSAKPVHRREKINFDDAKFLFTVSENIMSYLSEKILLGR